MDGLFQSGFSENGRGDRIRTYDPLFPKQMRYQAALRPDTALIAPVDADEKH